MPATPARAAFVAQAFRSATWSSAGVRALYGRVARDTKDQPVETFFDDPADAQIIANQRGLLIGSHARRFRATIDSLLLEDVLNLSRGVVSVRLIDDELVVDMTCAIAAIESVDLDVERTVVQLWGVVGPPPFVIPVRAGQASGLGAAVANAVAIAARPGGVATPPAHTYWRVLGVSNNGGGVTYFEEFEFRGSIGGADLVPACTTYDMGAAGKVIYSYDTTGSDAWRAFDNSTGIWAYDLSPGAWCGFEFPAPVEVKELAFKTIFHAGFQPTALKLQYADDIAGPWTDALSLTGLTTSVSTTYAYPIASGAGAVTAQGVGGATGVSQLIAASVGSSSGAGAQVATGFTAGISAAVGSASAAGAAAANTVSTDLLLLSGDMQSGADKLLLSGDMQSGSDLLLI